MWQRPCQDKNNLPPNTRQRVVSVVSQTMALCFPPAHPSCVFVFSIPSPLSGSIIYTAPKPHFRSPSTALPHTVLATVLQRPLQLLFIFDSTPTNSLSPQQQCASPPPKPSSAAAKTTPTRPCARSSRRASVAAIGKSTCSLPGRVSGVLPGIRLRGGRIWRGICAG